MTLLCRNSPTSDLCARSRRSDRATARSRRNANSAPLSRNSLLPRTGKHSSSSRRNTVSPRLRPLRRLTWLILTDPTLSPLAPPPPARTYPGGADAPGPSEGAAPQTIDGFDIPPDVDVPPQARGGDAAGSTDDALAAAAAEEASGDGGDKICPTCTFANPPDAGPDCEMCGLPLSG